MTSSNGSRLDRTPFEIALRRLPHDFTELVPKLRAFQRAAAGLPMEGEDAVSHLMNDAIAVQYVYYVGLVRTVLRDALVPGRPIEVLDWGGAYGHVAFLLDAVGLNATDYLYNVPVHFPEVAKALGIKYRVAAVRDPNAISCPDSAFDVVISSGVLEHVREYGGDERANLKELFRVTRPGGILFVWNLPAKFGAPEVARRLIRRWYHPVRFTADEATRLIASSGWSVLFHDQHEFLPMGVRAILHRRLGISPSTIFAFDYHLSRLPVLRFFHQHHTVIAVRPRT